MINDKETIRRMLRAAESNRNDTLLLNMLKTALAAELEMSDDVYPHSVSDILEEVSEIKCLLRRYQEEYGEIDE